MQEYIWRKQGRWRGGEEYEKKDKERMVERRNSQEYPGTYMEENKEAGEEEKEDMRRKTRRKMEMRDAEGHADTTKERGKEL